MTDSVTNKIILSADSTCDLDQELKERYHVHYFPLHIILDGKDYKDGIDITPEEIYQKYYDEKILHVGHCPSSRRDLPLHCLQR